MKVTGEELNRCAAEASCIALSMHEFIGEIGYGKLTREHAVNQLTKAIHNIICLRDKLHGMSMSIPWDGKGERK